MHTRARPRRQLAAAAGPQLNQFLPLLLSSLGRRLFDASVKEAVMAALQVRAPTAAAAAAVAVQYTGGARAPPPPQDLEHYGGRDAFDIIKSKVPTYATVYC